MESSVESLAAGMVLMWVVIVLVYGIFFAFVCSAVARGKNLSTSTWGILGFFFGILGLLAVAVMPAAPIENTPKPAQKTNWAILAILAVLAVVIVIAFTIGPNITASSSTFDPATGKVTPGQAKAWALVATWQGDAIKSTEKFTVGDDWKGNNILDTAR